MDKKIAQFVFDEFGVETEVTLTRPDPQFGDFATNVAVTAKILAMCRWRGLGL